MARVLKTYDETEGFTPPSKTVKGLYAGGCGASGKL